MCLVQRPKQVSPLAAPPPPADDPLSPALNEASADAANAANAVDGARRGRKSLRIDLDAASSTSGLNIPL